jgi:tetratricopeptide (TPR) repeat protein
VLAESGVQVVIRDLTEAPRLLQGWDLLEEAAEGGHRFRVELLRRWIAQFKPLSRVQEELDKINPLAEALYQAGEGFYRTGKLDEAASQLRQALGVNPNHLKASEILAEILISKGTRSALDEAQDVLEKLRENYSTVARPRLVHVFLKKAEASQLEAHVLEWYERALALDEGNASALAGKRRIWKERGDRARADGQFDEAAKAYTEAGREDLVQQAKDELRTVGLERLRAKVAELEKAEQYEAALELIRETGDTFVGVMDWAPDVGRLTRAAQALADYQRASGALRAGDRETAARLFAGVVAGDPKYKDASKLLHEAVSGVSVDELVAEQGQAIAQQQKRAERERSRLRVLATAASLAAMATGIGLGFALKTAEPPQPVAVPASDTITTTATAVPAPAACASTSGPSSRERPQGGVDTLDASAGRDTSSSASTARPIVPRPRKDPQPVPSTTAAPATAAPMPPAPATAAPVKPPPIKKAPSDDPYN